MKHILGNIGKPGLVVLVPPSEAPLAPEMTNDSWVLSSLAPFNGVPNDCFTETSLHLSFSNYHVPIVEADARGQQDASLFILESIVSVRHFGNWIADIDVLSSLKADIISSFPPAGNCAHKENEPPDFPLTAIGTWEEILDLPPGPVVAMAHGNSMARLAIVGILAGHRNKRVQGVKVCPPKVCWKCLGPELESEGAYTVFIY
jgi:hypothetical protein